MKIPYTVKELPHITEIETKSILKSSAIAHFYVAKIKGIPGAISNQTILSNPSKI